MVVSISLDTFVEILFVDTVERVGTVGSTVDLCMNGECHQQAEQHGGAAFHHKT